MFQQYARHAEAVTLASYKVAWNIAHAKKAYEEGNFIKQCLTDVIETLAPENKKTEIPSKISICHVTQLNTEYLR